MNMFPHEPVVLVDLPPFGTVALGDASGGLCGGTVFTVPDVFETPGLVPLPDAAPPGPDTPLFKYIAARLDDSFDLPHAGFAKYYDWMIAPDHDMGWPPFFVLRGIAWKTIVEEWNGHIRRRPLRSPTTSGSAILYADSSRCPIPITIRRDSSPRRRSGSVLPMSNRAAAS